MSFKSTSMMLNSQNKNRLLNFLSDVFEFEVDHADDSVRFEHLYFIIRQQSVISKDAQIEFLFKVNSSDDLEEIVEKLNFFQYRRIESGSIESYERIENENYETLIIFDIDNRVWKFEYFKGLK